MFSLFVLNLQPATLRELLLPPVCTSLWKKKRSGVLLHGKLEYYLTCKLRQIQSYGFFDTLSDKRAWVSARAFATLYAQWFKPLYSG